MDERSRRMMYLGLFAVGLLFVGILSGIAVFVIVAMIVAIMAVLLSWLVLRERRKKFEGDIEKLRLERIFETIDVENMDTGKLKKLEAFTGQEQAWIKSQLRKFKSASMIRIAFVVMIFVLLVAMV